MGKVTVHIGQTLKRFVFSMRLEEFVAFVYFWPMAYFTFKAYAYFQSQGHVPRLFVGDMKRLAIVVGVIILTYVIARKRPSWSFLRDALPFTYCIAIYTNLHDTVHFVNPHDIQDQLMAIDQWLFGVQPSLWAEQFIRPWLTEILSFCYMSFFLLTPVVALTLYLLKRRAQFRETLITVILCFYAGYLLYVIFPAVSPHIAMRDMYTLHFDGTPIADAAAKIVNILPSQARDAFPSLHTAVTLLTLTLAFKFVRWLFWILLPICLGLLISTVYLRQHYVIDLFAGAALAVIAYFFAPRLDRWWQVRSRALAGSPEGSV